MTFGIDSLLVGVSLPEGRDVPETDVPPLVNGAAAPQFPSHGSDFACFVPDLVKNKQ